MDPSLVTHPIVLAVPDHLSTMGLFLKADAVVKAVVILLILASVAVWAILIDRLVRVRGLHRQAARFAAAVRSGSVGAEAAEDNLAGRILAAGLAERHDAEDPLPESRAEKRERIERVMRGLVGVELRRLERGLPFLATVGSAAPFIGLFGTVWGIMNSFQAIARTQDTSLAVVAPGIAEALFATAIGLIAAIPAVIGYNKVTSDLGQAAYRLSSAIGELGARLTRGTVVGTRQKAAE